MIPGEVRALAASSALDMPAVYLRAILAVLLAIHDRADAAPTPAAEPSPSPRRGR